MRDVKSRIIFKINSTPEDPEKLVLPSIVWIGAGHPTFKNGKYKNYGGMIMIGWWHYSFSIGIVTLKQFNRKPKENPELLNNTN